MKLERVQLVNFLSHPSTDWEPNGTRLAAVVGANGAGKSALLDGVLYALYDAARAKTDGLVRLGETEMSALVVFTFNGQRYRVTRGRSSRGAGKSYLEVAVEAADGTWTSLTGDDIRSTQAVIEHLLGLDAEAFTTSVFLRQGESDAFLTATAGNRKKLLSTLLGLDVYARAEARARDDARTLEAATGFQRSTLERLDETIAELETAVEAKTQHEQELAGFDATLEADKARRARITGRLTALAAEIATGDAAAAEVARLEAERTALADRYRREKGTVVTAEATIIQAQAVTASGPEVAAAIAALPALQATVAALREAEGRDTALATEIEQRRKAFDPLERALSNEIVAWTADLRGAQARVTELIAGVNALEPVVCRKCGTANVVDQADLAGQLRTARARAAELEAAKPTETMDLSRERVAIKRLEERRAEAGWDPAPYAAARERLGELERTAVRGEAIEQARAAVAAAEAAKTSAAAELVKIEASGLAIAERIRVATEATSTTKALIEEQTDLSAEARRVDEAIDLVERQRRQSADSLATAIAHIERRDQLTSQRDAVAVTLTEADVALTELRRLVAAFGVTGIPARIIEGVLPELSGYANELLGELRPGMVLEIRAQRAKRDGKGVVEALDLIVRDEVGERPLAVFSGGERMSVSLAIATALSRLVACRAGTAIRTLVIDEPDGLDADARRSFGQALRVLAHHGELERVVLVSHHPDLAEFGDAVYQVTKDGSGSTVELVA